MKASSSPRPASRRFLSLAALAALLINVGAELCAHADSWSGAAEVFTVGSMEDRVLWTLRPSLMFKGDFSLAKSSRWSIAGEGRVRYDQQLQFQRSRSHWDARLDRAVVNWQGETSSVSMGFQKFTWGDFGFLDGVDQVNPRDLSEPVYGDDELRKLALPALSFQSLADNRVFQIVWAARTEGTPLPEESDGLRIERDESFHSQPPFEFAVKAGGLLKSGWDLNGYLLSHLERAPQGVVKTAQQGARLVAYEPRVFTLGLTGTQAVDDFVFRTEFAFHSNRALPAVVQNVEVVADQAVLNLNSDVTLGNDLLLSGQLHAEKWLTSSRSDFKSNNSLVGVGVQKPFWDRKVETNVSLLLSPDGTESLLSGQLTLKVLDAGEFSLAVYEAQTSTGRALRRRGLQDLVVSHFKYLF